MLIRTLIAAACVLAGSQAHAQTQPYAGMQERGVKALSEQQIEDLRKGRGMGLALPAELNGYPGPIHVLELGDQLALSPAQRHRLEDLYAAMKAEAVPLGERLIAEEAHLDRLFAQRTVTANTLAAATSTIGDTQGALRAAHLKYHLSTADLLDAEQIARYAQLRGYGGSPDASSSHGDHRRPGAHRP
jgi:hypothetical protein